MILALKLTYLVIGTPLWLPFPWYEVARLESFDVVLTSAHASALRAIDRTLQSEFVGFLQLTFDAFVSPIGTEQRGKL